MRKKVIKALGVTATSTAAMVLAASPAFAATYSQDAYCGFNQVGSNVWFGFHEGIQFTAVAHYRTWSGNFVSSAKSYWVTSGYGQFRMQAAGNDTYAPVDIQLTFPSNIEPAGGKKCSGPNLALNPGDQVGVISNSGVGAPPVAVPEVGAVGAVPAQVQG